MSIFKGTLDPIIAAQLKARETIVSSENRSPEFLIYTTGKNSFVRLSSFVNYDSFKFNKNKFEKDDRYKDDQLSKKWVLEGGTLYNGTSLRSGIGSENSVYVSDLDYNNAAKKSNTKKGLGVDRLYGIRPMPGITSVQVTHKNAYGSLREATINFYCWDRHQLEELEVLYMRVGYSCFLEWGWSQYLDHGTAPSTGDSPINNVPSNIQIKNFSGKTLDVFQTGLSDDYIYNEIDGYIKKYKGNYDAMLGYVKNFSWQLMPNGGFQCSTTLISRGEVIDTIKVSGNPNSMGGSIASINSSVPPESKPILSLFEKIFLNITGKINDAEFFKNQVYQNIRTNKDGTPSTGQFYIDNLTPDQQNQLRDEVDKTYQELNIKLLKGNYKGYINGNIVSTNPSTIDLDKNTVVKLIEGGTNEGAGIEYISMNSFIAILNEFFVFKNTKLEPAVNIVIPFDTPCLTSEDSVSIDPTTCLINNPKATFITDIALGFQPKIYTEVDSTTPSFSTGLGSSVKTLPDFIQGKNNIGSIGNIYISISKIIQIYRNLSGGPDGVDLIQLLQEVLDSVSFALGGINDFKLYNDKNIVQIIDVKYFENDSPKNKFKFDLIGLKSICRDVKMNSRIFAEQSTMIAIGATSGDKNANLGDIYSSTQNYFNYGLKDRVLKTIYTDNTNASFTINGVTLTGEDAYYFQIWYLVRSLTDYLQKKVLGEASPTSQGGSFVVSKIPQSNEVVNAGSLLKSFHYQINVKDTSFKALIPFELEITLDGIGGLIVGQIFTIDKTILPRDYSNKNIGFIITGINHSLENNDWTTNIRTQICLLENDKITIYNANKSLLKQKIKEIDYQTKKTGWLLAALSDYMVNLTILAMYNSPKNSSKSNLYDLINALNTDNIEVFTGTPGSYPSNKFLLKTLLGAFAGGSYGVEDYLKNWYAYAKNNIPDPNFPKTYDDFTTTVLSSGITKKFNVAKFDQFIALDSSRGARSAVINDTATEASYKTAFNGIFIGQVMNYFIQNPPSGIKFGGFDININEEELAGSGYVQGKSVNLQDNIIQQIDDPYSGQITGKVNKNKYKKFYITSIQANIGQTTRPLDLYANLKQDALRPMWTLYFNYLKGSQGQTALDLNGFDPIGSKTDSFEKVIQ